MGWKYEKAQHSLREPIALIHVRLGASLWLSHVIRMIVLVLIQGGGTREQVFGRSGGESWVTVRYSLLKYHEILEWREWLHKKKTEN